jgi:hypothetical protein
MRAFAVVAALFVLAFFPVAPRDASAAAGETVFAFLKLGVGARPMGLGSAYVALADDPTATYWNPAGLAAVRATEVTAMHNEWIQDFRHEHVAIGTPLGTGTLGLSFSGFYGSELERRDDTGALTGHFGFNDIAMTAAYGRPIAAGLDAGAAVRYVRSMIDDVDATSLSFDLGGRYRMGESGFSLGAAVQNLGGEATYIEEGFPIPTTLRVGAAWSKSMTSLKGRGTLTTELRKARAEDARLHAGAEFAYHDRVALRVGGKFGYDEEDLSFGIGLTQSRIRFDYALVPLSSDLGTAHLFSITARLGGER